MLHTIIKNAQIVLCTLNGASSHVLKNIEFDVVLIDEATQALESECWIAIQKGKKLILAGDPLQLPPTIKSQTGPSHPLSVTLFDRLLKVHGEGIKKLLNVQYRMNDAIMHYSSKTLYDSKLVSHSSVASHVLSDLPSVIESDVTNSPLIFIDSTGQEETESTDEEMISKFNVQEAHLVLCHLHELLECNILPSWIGIISPYQAQVHLISKLVKPHYPEIEVSSVDGFQGREKEVIIVSLVRCNDQGEVGFLQSTNRLNVALTRAKRQLCVVGNGKTLARDASLKMLVGYLEASAELMWYDVFNHPNPFINS